MASRNGAPYDEPPEVVAAVAKRSGVDEGYAGSVLRDLHHVVDRLVADDWSVLLGPLYLTMRGDPVLARILDRFTDEDWADPNGYKTADPEVLARYLDLSVDEVVMRPPAFGTTVLNVLADRRAVAEDDDAEWRQLDSVVWAWRHHLDVHGVDYRVSAAGLEADFDSWLCNNLQVLSEDYPVRIVAAQHRFSNRRRLDFLCEFTGDTELAREGDLLVIENKVRLANTDAFIQLSEYVDLVEVEIATDGRAVEGLLICDGTTVELQHRLLEAGFGVLTLSTIGYRDHLYRQEGLNRAVEPGQLDLATGVALLEGPSLSTTRRPRISAQVSVPAEERSTSRRRAARSGNRSGPE